jgi:hypothetical protein
VALGLQRLVAQALIASLFGGVISLRHDFLDVSVQS